MRTRKAEGGEGCTCLLFKGFSWNSSVSPFCTEHDIVSALKFQFCYTVALWIKK